MAATRMAPLAGRRDHREEILAELLKLSKHEQLTPDATVAKAADPKNPLHGEFEWDDSVAAHQHRLDQARHLISSFEIIYEQKEIIFHVQQFVRNPTLDSSQQGYVPFQSLQSKKAMAREFVDAQLTIALTFVQKAHIYASVLDQESEFRRLIATINRLVHK